MKEFIFVRKRCIERNHDYTHFLPEKPERMENILRKNYRNAFRQCPWIRYCDKTQQNCVESINYYSGSDRMQHSPRIYGPPSFAAIASSISPHLSLPNKHTLQPISPTPKNDSSLDDQNVSFWYSIFVFRSEIVNWIDKWISFNAAMSGSKPLLPPCYAYVCHKSRVSYCLPLARSHFSSSHVSIICDLDEHISTLVVIVRTNPKLTPVNVCVCACVQQQQQHHLTPSPDWGLFIYIYKYIIRLRTQHMTVYTYTHISYDRK